MTSKSEISSASSSRRSCWWLCCVPVWTVGGVSGVCLGMDSAGAVWVCAWMHQLPAWAERLRSGNGPQLVIMLPSTLNSTRRRFRELLGGIHPQKCFDDPVAVLSTKIILARQLQEGSSTKSASFLVLYPSNTALAVLSPSTVTSSMCIKMVCAGLE